MKRVYFVRELWAVLLILALAVPARQVSGGPNPALAMRVENAESKVIESGLEEALQHKSSAGLEEGEVNLNQENLETLRSELKQLQSQVGKRVLSDGAIKGIIAWRRENGLFTSIDQLKQIRGIGPSTLSQILDKLRPIQAATWRDFPPLGRSRLLLTAEPNVQAGAAGLVRLHLQNGAERPVPGRGIRLEIEPPPALLPIEEGRWEQIIQELLRKLDAARRSVAENIRADVRPLIEYIHQQVDPSFHSPVGNDVDGYEFITLGRYIEWHVFHRLGEMISAPLGLQEIGVRRFTHNARWEAIPYLSGQIWVSPVERSQGSATGLAQFYLATYNSTSARQESPIKRYESVMGTPSDDSILCQQLQHLLPVIRQREDPFFRYFGEARVRQEEIQHAKAFLWAQFFHGADLRWSPVPEPFLAEAVVRPDGYIEHKIWNPTKQVFLQGNTQTISHWAPLLFELEGQLSAVINIMESVLHAEDIPEEERDNWAYALFLEYLLWSRDGEQDLRTLLTGYFFSGMFQDQTTMVQYLRQLDLESRKASPGRKALKLLKGYYHDGFLDDQDRAQLLGLTGMEENGSRLHTPPIAGASNAGLEETVEEAVGRWLDGYLNARGKIQLTVDARNQLIAALVKAPDETPQLLSSHRIPFKNGDRRKLINQVKNVILEAKQQKAREEKKMVAQMMSLARDEQSPVFKGSSPATPITQPLKPVKERVSVEGKDWPEQVMKIVAQSFRKKTDGSPITKEKLRQWLSPEDLAALGHSKPDLIEPIVRLYATAGHVSLEENKKNRLVKRLQFISRKHWGQKPDFFRTAATSLATSETKEQFEDRLRSFQEAARAFVRGNPDDPWSFTVCHLIEEPFTEEQKELLFEVANRIVAVFFPGDSEEFRKSYARELVDMTYPFSIQNIYETLPLEDFGDFPDYWKEFDGFISRLLGGAAGFASPTGRHTFVSTSAARGSLSSLAALAAHEYGHQALYSMANAEGIWWSLKDRESSKKRKDRPSQDWVTIPLEVLIMEQIAQKTGQPISWWEHAAQPGVDRLLYEEGQQLVRQHPVPVEKWIAALRNYDGFPDKIGQYAQGHIIAGIARELGRQAAMKNPDVDPYESALDFVSGYVWELIPEDEQMRISGDSSTEEPPVFNGLIEAVHDFRKEYKLTEPTAGLEENGVDLNQDNLDELKHQLKMLQVAVGKQVLSEGAIKGIIAFRRTSLFTSLNQLTTISGIGQGTLSQIRDKLRPIQAATPSSTVPTLVTPLPTPVLPILRALPIKKSPIVEQETGTLNIRVSPSDIERAMRELSQIGPSEVAIPPAQPSAINAQTPLQSFSSVPSQWTLTSAETAVLPTREIILLPRDRPSHFANRLSISVAPDQFENFVFQYQEEHFRVIPGLHRKPMIHPPPEALPDNPHRQEAFGKLLDLIDGVIRSIRQIRTADLRPIKEHFSHNQELYGGFSLALPDFGSSKEYRSLKQAVEVDLAARCGEMVHVATMENRLRFRLKGPWEEVPYLAGFSTWLVEAEAMEGDPEGLAQDYRGAYDPDKNRRKQIQFYENNIKIVPGQTYTRKEFQRVFPGIRQQEKLFLKYFGELKGSMEELVHSRAFLWGALFHGQDITSYRLPLPVVVEALLRPYSYVDEKIWNATKQKFIKGDQQGLKKWAGVFMELEGQLVRLLSMMEMIPRDPEIAQEQQDDWIYGLFLDYLLHVESNSGALITEDQQRYPVELSERIYSYFLRRGLSSDVELIHYLRQLDPGQQKPTPGRRAMRLMQEFYDDIFLNFTDRQQVLSSGLEEKWIYTLRSSARAVVEQAMNGIIPTIVGRELQTAAPVFQRLFSGMKDQNIFLDDPAAVLAELMEHGIRDVVFVGLPNEAEQFEKMATMAGMTKIRLLTPEQGKQQEFVRLILKMLGQVTGLEEDQLHTLQRFDELMTGLEEMASGA